MPRIFWLVSAIIWLGLGLANAQLALRGWRLRRRAPELLWLPLVVACLSFAAAALLWPSP